MPTRPRPHEPRLPELPAAIASLDAVLRSSAAQVESVRLDEDLARRVRALDGRPVFEGGASAGRTRAVWVLAALMRELDGVHPDDLHAASCRQARARLFGSVCARFARLARVRPELPAGELEVAGGLHELGVLLARVDLDRDETAEHARIAGRLARAWGVSGALVEALEGHHAEVDELVASPPRALLALSERVVQAACRRRPAEAEGGVSIDLARGLGLRRADLARAIELAANELAGIAA